MEENVHDLLMHMGGVSVRAGGGLGGGREEEEEEWAMIALFHVRGRGGEILQGRKSQKKLQKSWMTFHFAVRCIPACAFERPHPNSNHILYR